MEQSFLVTVFRFFGILGQPREVHPKFRNKILENVFNIRSPTRMSGLLDQMESTLNIPL